MVHTTSRKRWSKLEDSYITLSLQKGLPTSEIAKTLNRTSGSVSTRKWALGLEGRFKSSERGTKIQSTKRIGLVQDPNQEFVETFKLESGIPIPTRKERNPEAKSRARIILAQMKPGQSFVVPKSDLYFVKAVYKAEFEAYKIKITPTLPNGKFFRIFRVA